MHRLRSVSARRAPPRSPIRRPVQPLVVRPYPVVLPVDVMYVAWDTYWAGSERTGNSCREGNEWSYSDESLQSKTGRVYCWFDRDTRIVWVIWTADWASIWGWAGRDDGDAQALLDWFRHNRGPYDPSS